MTTHRHKDGRGTWTTSVTDPDLSGYAKQSDLAALAARIAALGLLDANGSVLGPVGAYLLDRIGRAGTLVGLLSVILAWTAVPLGVAIAVQRRRDL